MSSTIAYVLPFDVSRQSGLLRLLEQRLSVWRALGLDVLVVICARHDSEIARRTTLSGYPLVVLTASRSFLAMMKLPGWLQRSGATAVYARYTLPWPTFLRIDSKMPIVYELHADETKERRVRPISYRVLSRLFSDRVLSRAAGLVCISEEVAASAHLQRFDVPRTVVSNGVDIDWSIDFGGARQREPGPPRLILSIGSSESWQGLDKFLQLASLCPGMEFHVVGADVLTDAGENVHWHGRVSSSEHDAILARMDVGFGNLGLERIDRQSATPLKVRQYIRAGLGVVLAHSDSDLADLSESILRIPYGFAVTHAIAEQVDDFCHRMVGRYCDISLARAVDLTKKEQARATFLSKYLAGQPE